MDENLLKLDQYLTYIADKLQKPVEFAHDMLLRQVYFEGAWAGVWVITTVITLFFLWKFLYPRAKFNLAEGDNNDNDFGILQATVILVATLAGPFVFFSNLYNLMQILINPYWYMIQLAASLVK